MRNFFQSGQVLLVAGLIFLLIGTLAEKSGVYIALGVVLLLVSPRVRKKRADRDSQRASREGTS